MTTPPPHPGWPSGPSAEPEPPPRDGGLPLQPTRRYRALIAALVVAVVVLAGIAGTTGYLLFRLKHANPVPHAQSAPSSSAAVPSTTAAPVIGPPGLTPFLGRWSGGNPGGSIEIDPNGMGRWIFNDRSTCPDAPMVGCGIIGIAAFTLTSVVNGTATGSVIATSNPNHDPLGERVTIALGTGLQGKGTVLSVSIGKMKGWNFCNQTSPHYCSEG